MPRAVIFDVDGVLVDSGPAHHESWRIVAGRHGIDVTAERFASTFGRPSRDIIRILWGTELDDRRVRAIDDEKEAAYRELVRGRLPLMPGCRETLARLRSAGLRIAVATSGPPENLALVLDEGGLRPHIVASVHGFDVACGKPAPDCYRLAAERLRIDPRCCLVVEDAPVGVEAGTAAGMTVVGLAAPPGDRRLLDAGAVQTVGSLIEVEPALVDRLLTRRPSV